MRRNNLIAILAAVVLAPWLHAHSLHQSTAEAEYNAKSRRLEVSLTVFINDLELALIRQCEREIRIHKTPAAEFDTQTQAYLARTFIVRDATGKAGRIAWVGRELDAASAKSEDPAVTLFFEVALPGSPADIRLKHAIFHDFFKDQVNLLLLRDGTRRTELRFTSGQPELKLEISG